jgi:hypothetical protein
MTLLLKSNGRFPNFFSQPISRVCILLKQMKDGSLIHWNKIVINDAANTDGEGGRWKK